MGLITGETLRDWALVAVSLFNTVLLLWLGLTLWLHADRRDPGVVLSAGGFLLGSLFFISHSALLLSNSWDFTRSNTLWLAAAMIPVLLLPYVWYVVLLRNAGYWMPGAIVLQQRHRSWLLFTTVILAIGFGCLALLGIPFIPGINSLTAFIWPLRQLIKVPILGIPLVAIAYPLYVLLCVALSIDTLRGQILQSGKSSVSFRHSRTLLIAATLVLLIVAALVAVAVVWAITNTREGSYYVLRQDDINIITAFDFLIALLIALVVFLLGQAMTRYELFTGKALPRRELARQWKRAIALALGYGVLLGGALVLGLEPVYAVLLTAGLMTVFFVLLGWRTSVEWRQAMRQLRPMVSSLGWYERLTAGPSAPLHPAQADPPIAPQTDRSPFDVLCEDVLAAPLAYLIPAGPLASFVEPQVYPAGRSLPPGAWIPPASASPQQLAIPISPEAYGGAAWAIPLWSDQGLAGGLLLGPREDGSLYSEEELDIGRAVGERLIDAAASLALSQKLMQLQREQMTATQLLDQRTRRVLHDEVLPLIHTAMLALPSGAAAQTAMARLSEAHGQVSALLRDLPVTTTPDVARLGPLAALRKVVEDEFSVAFSTVTWECDEDAEQAVAELPPMKAETLYYAARELVRNAARHAQPTPDAGRQLRIKAACKNGQLIVTVEDNGEGSGAAAAAGHGLELHTALMAIAGGSLTVETAPGKGVRGELTVRYS